MRPVLTGRLPLSFCLSVCPSVGPLVTSAYCRKTADTIEMMLAVVGWVNSRNDVVDGDPDPPGENGGIGWRNVTYRENAASDMQKRLNQAV